MRRFHLCFSVLIFGCSLTFASTSSVVRRGAPVEATLPTGTRFSEPLIATAPTSATEDLALSQALDAYANRTSSEDLSSLESYVKQHPGSGWNIALETNLGLLDSHFGYFTKAMGEWEAAWSQGRDLKEPRAKALADRAAGELVGLSLRTGNFDRVEALLKEVSARPVSGSAAQSVSQATVALSIQRDHPEESAQLCGPEAIRSLLASVGATPKQLAILDNYRSPAKGESLVQLAQLANKAAVNYGVVFRQAGQPVPVPSIVHWKFGHYAAIVGEANGKFRVLDPLFGRDQWVTPGAIDAEASGYFLASKASKQITAVQWRPVGVREASQVHGAYRIKFNSPPTANDHDLSSGAGCTITGCVAYDIHEQSVSLLLQATPVGYAPPTGPPVNVTLSYNQREAYQPSNFSFFNVSPNWTLNWLTYIQDDPTSSGASVTSYISGGGGEPYAGFNSKTGAFTAQLSTGAVLVLVSSSPVVYQLRYPNGAIDVYSQSDGSKAYPRNVFLKQRIDPAGNAVALNYDSQLRLTSLRDAIGNLTTFSYDLSAFPLLITKVTDPFSRSAKLSYTSDGHLNAITDVSGLTSSFTYDSSFLVNSMTTPYGTTNFTYGNNTVGKYYALYLYIQDPLGLTEGEQFAQSAPGVAQTDALIPQGNIIINNRLMNSSDSFHWDKHQYKLASSDYTMARNKTFDHLANVADTSASVVEALKQPLEYRVWYDYPGQTTNTEYRSAQTGTFDFVSRIGRVLDDGSTQLSQADYNSVGNVNHRIDPVGRETYYDYAANGIDIVDVRQRTSSTDFTVIATYTYNSQHLPLTYTDAAGSTTTYIYTPAGQLAKVTNALGNVTQYQYDATGHVTRVVNAFGHTQMSYTYDTVGRIATETDSGGYTLAFTYDALDRVTQKTYPDGTFDQNTYKNLDLVATTDRLGNTTKYAYDANRNLISTTDLQGNKTTRTYYENGVLKSLTDANGNKTSWTIDLQGRVTAVTYPDGTQLTTNYEANTSRIASTVDALGQTKQFAYALDDQIAGLSYQNAVNPTPNVAFTYDPYFQRVVSMADGSGTTKYLYHIAGSAGALQLAVESVLSANSSLTYTYDALGRLSQRSVNGNNETFAYDSIGRPITHTSVLGTFSRTYLDYSNQIASSLLSGSTIGTVYDYHQNTNDRRLWGIENISDGARTYYLPTNSENQITQVDVKALPGSAPPLSYWRYTYDSDSRLATAIDTATGSYQFTNDPAGNAIAFSLPAANSTATYNDDNQIFNLTTGKSSTSLTYDAAGNVLNDGVFTYTWDAENRLLSATSNADASTSTTFRYDGLGRRVAIVVSTSAKTTENDYAWCGQSICGSRTIDGTIVRLYFPEGEYFASSAISSYYAQDQVGSVRDILAVRGGASVGGGHYDYDAFGNLLANSGKTTTDFGYAGMFYEPNSGLNLTLDRAYSARLMRWLSRDQFGLPAAPNPYLFKNGNPVSPCDPKARDCQSSALTLLGLTQPPLSN